MLYRNFPKIPGKDISILALGTSNIPDDYQKALELVKQAIDHGTNYFNTDSSVDAGKKNELLGTILNSLNMRKAIYLADRLPLSQITSQNDVEATIDNLFLKQCAALQTNFIDFYLLHIANEADWNKARDFLVLPCLARLKQDGKIGHIGLSFSGSLDFFKTLVQNCKLWEFCQIEYNYLSTTCPETQELLNYAALNGLGIVSSRPFNGGILALPPAEVISIFAKANKPRMAYEWALRWVWENQNIVCAVSNMQTPHVILSNVAIASSGYPNSLPQSQIKVVEEVAQWLQTHPSCNGIGVAQGACAH